MNYLWKYLFSFGCKYLRQYYEIRADVNDTNLNFFKELWFEEFLFKLLIDNLSQYTEGVGLISPVFVTLTELKS